MNPSILKICITLSTYYLSEISIIGIIKTCMESDTWAVGDGIGGWVSCAAKWVSGAEDDEIFCGT